MKITKVQNELLKLLKEKDVFLDYYEGISPYYMIRGMNKKFRCDTVWRLIKLGLLKDEGNKVVVKKGGNNER